jgi:sialate O-acetylesterase
MSGVDKKAILKFKSESLGGGLVSSDDKALRGFLVAGADKKFTAATAVIEGDSVVVTSSKVKKPVAVRYGWYPSDGGVNFFNKAGFPCGLFRTDNFRLSTDRTPKK